MQKVIDLLAGLLSDESLLAGAISSPRDKKSPLTKISIRPILLQDHLQYQFTYHEAQRVKHRNLDRAECQAEIMVLLKTNYRRHSYSHGRLITIFLLIKPIRPRS